MVGYLKNGKAGSAAGGGSSIGTKNAPGGVGGCPPSPFYGDMIN